MPAFSRGALHSVNREQAMIGIAMTFAVLILAEAALGRVKAQACMRLFT